MFSKQHGLHRKPGPPVHDDLVERVFTVDAPNELWITEDTEHPTAEGKLNLCVVKDVYSDRVVGYSMGSRVPSSYRRRAGECGAATQPVRDRDALTSRVQF